MIHGVTETSILSIVYLIYIASGYDITFRDNTDQSFFT
jgi:hypothetical protein